MPDETAPLSEQLELLQRQLRDAQRMAALGELASTTTHEFNNVLMTVLNYAKLGLRHRDDATRDKAFTKILDAAKRAEKITNGVLGLARNRGTERAPTDLAELVDQSLVLLEREMRKYRVQVEKSFQPAPHVNVCGNQIQQVLLNLMTNARQAMPEGGRLIVAVDTDESTGAATLQVRDTGTGISQEKLPHIFARYYSTKDGPDASGKGGTGLGLAMCREIVQQHEGRIRVESTPGVGTAFTLIFPPAKPDAIPKQVAALGVPVAT